MITARDIFDAFARAYTVVYAYNNVNIPLPRLQVWEKIDARQLASYEHMAELLNEKATQQKVVPIALSLWEEIA